MRSLPSEANKTINKGRGSVSDYWQDEVYLAIQRLPVKHLNNGFTWQMIIKPLSPLLSLCICPIPCLFSALTLLTWHAFCKNHPSAIPKRWTTYPQKWYRPVTKTVSNGSIDLVSLKVASCLKCMQLDSVGNRSSR